MSATNFDNCLNVILHHEGGFSNHPADPGGVTNLGVTKKAYEAYVGRTVTVNEMKALTVSKVKPFYKTQYWDKVKCDQLPPGLDLCVFDFAVNAGVSRAARLLQRMVGSLEDGQIGPVTLKRIADAVAAKGVDSLITSYQNMRQSYYESLSTYRVFGKGWSRRVKEVEAAAKKM